MEPEIDIKEQLVTWRAKAAAGTLSMPEMREAIAYLRTLRTSATTKAKAKGTSKKVINSEEMLGELAGL
jgi:hypothetical protein